MMRCISCILFGISLILERENWSRLFVNFVIKYDIVSRIMLARKASIEQTLPYVLGRWNSIHESDQRITEFYTAVLNDLGLSARAKQSIHAALEAEKQQVDNEKKIGNKMPRIIERLKWIVDEYKPKCQAHKNGYYDSFKVSNEENDFKANVKRAELAGIFDEVLGLVKKGQLPDGFEGRREWVELATHYRRLIEPLDIANYHRHLKNEDTGPYMARGRPNRCLKDGSMKMKLMVSKYFLRVPHLVSGGVHFPRITSLINSPLRTRIMGETRAT